MKPRGVLIRYFLLLPMALGLSVVFMYASSDKGSLFPHRGRFYACNSLSVSSDTLTLVFVGDLMQHQAQITAAHKGQDTYSYEECFKYVAPELRKADLAIGNLEVTLGGKPYRGYPSFSAPDSFLKALQSVGFDVLLFANNHCLDRGNRGAVRTLNKMDSLKMIHTGVFRNPEEHLNTYPLLVERKGIRIAFLNYTYDTNGLRPASPLVVNYIDKEQIRKDVVKARLMRPDVIIACMHWGIEYELLPRRGERELAKFLLGLGVDHVIGSHPHVVQPVEVLEDESSPSSHLVAYSLGNFISNMSAKHTDGGMMLRMVLKKVQNRTRMVDCGYSYVWMSRPSFNQKGQFYVYPSVVDDNRLNINEKERKDVYLRGARPVVERYSKGIKEYFFLKITEKCLQIKKKSIPLHRF